MGGLRDADSHVVEVVCEDCCIWKPGLDLGSQISNHQSQNMEAWKCYSELRGQEDH